MIRIIVKSLGGYPDGTAGVPEWRTFDIKAKELEAFLTETARPNYREIIGADVFPDGQPGE